jgi:flagellar M-ring protein FliF
MEFIKKNLLQIREQLGNLSLSQKMLFFMIAVMIAVSLFWTVFLTATPELIPLLDQNQTMSEQQIASIQNLLDQWDVYYKVETGKILVKRQDRDRLYARLFMSQALPSDTAESWRKLILEADMWLPQEDRQNRWQLAKEQRLEQIIQYMEGVEQARVIINQGSKRLLSEGPSSDPSASVSIKMQSGKKPGKALVMGIADLVAGAVDRLARERVNIIVNGASYKIPGEDSPFTGDGLEARREYERYFSEKIQQSLGIGNALVGVFVEMETETVKTESKKYGEAPVIREMKKEDTSEQRNQTGEPGVRPNTGAVVATANPASPPGEKSSKTEEETEYSTDRDVTHTVKHNLPGAVKTIRATVNIPYSYFVDIYKQQTGKTEKPKEADLAPIIAAQLKSIQKKVLPIINATDPASVEVSHYYDPTPSEQNVALASSGGVSMPQMTQYLKPAGLGLLAFCSLIMVLVMLKKASNNVGISNLERAMATQEPVNTLDTDSTPIGEAGGSEGVLEGIEVDEDTLRTRKMSEQVSTMVKEDPAAAAALVKQWILKDH